MVFNVGKVPASAAQQLALRTDIGLSQVDNTADLDKPVSTSMTAALAGKIAFSDLVSNASGKGSELVALSGGPVNNKLSQYITFATPEAYGAVGDYWLPNGSVNPNPTDNTIALQTMLDDNLYVRFGTRGYRTGYFTGSLKLRPGHVIEAPFCAGSTDITATRGTYLVGIPGINEIIDTITNTAGYIKIDGLGLYGRDFSMEGVNLTQIRSAFYNMHVIRCRNGFNRANAPGLSDTYGRSGCHFFNVTACNNVNGAVNTVDSKFIFGRFASNTQDGIQFNTGANDNMIVGTKLDFNSRWGIRSYTANRLTIITENIDRNGMGGIYLNGCNNVKVDAYTQRNGRQGGANATVDTTSGSNVITATAVTGGMLAVDQIVTGNGIPAGTVIQALGTGTSGTGTYILSANATATATAVAIVTERPVSLNCHVYIAGCTGLVMTLRSSARADDDGEGYVSPKSSIVLAGINQLTLLGDVTGCTGVPISELSGSSITNTSTLLASGATAYVSGVSAWTEQTAQVSVGGSQTITISNLPAITDNLFRSYTVTVVAKRSDSGSQLFRIKFALTMVRSTGVPTIAVSAISEEIGTTGSIALSGTPTVSLIGTITTNASGTSLSFPITNQHATANVRTRIHVRPDG